MTKISIQTFKNKLMTQVINLEEEKDSNVLRSRPLEEWVLLYKQALEELEEK